MRCSWVLLIGGWTVACATSPDGDALDISNTRRSEGPATLPDGPAVDGSAPVPSLEPSDERAGTRLLNAYEELRSADGALVKTFHAFWDPVLGSYCRIQYTADHRPRCVPLSQEWAEEVYTDARCTTPALVFGPLAHPCYPSRKRPPTLYAHVDQGSCSEKFLSVANAAASTQLSQIYLRDAKGSCIASEVPQGFEAYPRAVAGDVPVSAFVPFTSKETVRQQRFEMSGVRLRVLSRTLLGEDGAFVQENPHILDSEMHTYCDPVRLSDGAIRCAPAVDDLQPLLAQRTFSDSRCTDETWKTTPATKMCDPDDRDPNGKFVRAPFTSEGCAAHNVYRRPAELATHATYAEHDGKCERRTAGTANEPVIAESELAPVESGSFALMGEWEVAEETYLGRSGTRLEVRSPYISSFDGLRYRKRAAVLYDRQLQTACEYTIAADGYGRCVPIAPVLSFNEINPRFSDPACSMPVWGTRRGPSESSCKAPSGKRFLRTLALTHGCSVMRVVQATQPPLVVAQLYEFAAGRCQKADEDAADYDLFEGTPFTIDPSQFAEMDVAMVH